MGKKDYLPYQKGNQSMNTKIEANMPEPILVNEKLKLYNRKTDVGQTIEALKKGDWILIKEFYSDGISLLKDLHKYLTLKLPNKTFKEQQKYRSEYHKLSNLILLEIVDQKLCTKKSPSIGC